MVGILFTALWRGWLWTKPQVREFTNQMEKRVTTAERDRDEWRGIALKAMDNADKLAPQLDAIQSAQVTNNALLSALRGRAEAGTS